ncbi:MAG: hypothetical protein A4E35_00711 [Methanoregula sp. PtaU1.Bin051]|nr:MAG: hypothetical protein A4E35_00711 [Methanoregula sp. PtaU1.Bin051]
MALSFVHDLTDNEPGSGTDMQNIFDRTANEMAVAGFLHRKAECPLNHPTF